MCRATYLIALTCLFYNSVFANINVTHEEVSLEALVNLTNNNELWTILLKDCQKPTLTCVQNNIYKYFKQILDDTSDIQFTSYLKFSKNSLDYPSIKRSFEAGNNHTKDEESDLYDDESPIESMSRSLQGNTEKFFMTHDIELSLPETLFPNGVLKISPRAFEAHGALVKLEVAPSGIDSGMVEGRTFKKIRKFITERLLYALLAILLVIKLLAVKFLFIFPLIVGAATAKKLLLKILLFVFPALHHLFKFCAYYPIQAKYHHHKHLISHIHEVAPHKHHYDHHEGVEIVDPHSHGPPIEYHGPHGVHHEVYDDEISVLPDDGTGFPDHYHWISKVKHFASKFGRFAFFAIRKMIHTLIANPWLVELIKKFSKRTFHWSVYFVPWFVGSAIRTFISHRRDPNRDDNEVDSWGQGQQTRRGRPKRPLTTMEMERMVAKAEKEAIIKARLQKERQRIREENLRLQDQLNQDIKIQEKLKQQSAYFSSKIPSKVSSPLYTKPYAVKIQGSPSNKFFKGSFMDPSNLPHASVPDGIDLPVGYIPKQKLSTKSQVNHLFQPKQIDLPHQPIYKPSSQTQLLQNTEISIRPSTEYNNQIDLHHQPIYKPSAQIHSSQNQDINRRPSTEFDIQKSVEYDIHHSFDTKDSLDQQAQIDTRQPNDFGSSDDVEFDMGQSIQFEKARPVEKSKAKPKLEQEIYQAASITHDPFYSPILEKIDKILQGLGFNDELCKERLICSMYKNPAKFSPHSNLLSAELSRDSTELEKPTRTNSAVIRFYKYVQAARDGQDQRDCLRLYPGCLVNTEVS